MSGLITDAHRRRDPAPTVLDPAEQIEIHAGVEVLQYGMVSASSGPTVVFLPGGSHLARIAYGHPGAASREYLASAIVRQGLNFLGVSYPSDFPAFSSPRPELTIRDWGRAAADATRGFIDEYGLDRRVIVCGWSAGGRSAHAFTDAARSLGLDVRCFIALAGSPPIPGVFPTHDPPQPRLGADHLWGACGPDATPGVLENWVGQLSAPDHFPAGAVISPEIYLQHYLVRHSVNLLGEAERFDGRRGVVDPAGAARDTGSGSWSQFPLCAAIAPDGADDLRHALADHLSWPAITAFGIVERLLPQGPPEPRLWSSLRERVRSLSTSLCRHVEAGHFFFVGHSRAEQTARHIYELWQETEDLASLVASGRLSTRTRKESEYA